MSDFIYSAIFAIVLIPVMVFTTLCSFLAFAFLLGKLLRKYQTPEITTTKRDEEDIAKAVATSAELKAEYEQRLRSDGWKLAK